MTRIIKDAGFRSTASALMIMISILTHGSLTLSHAPCSC